MPKIVNHEEKRDQIAKATWRVILNQGMEGATVRNIASEAGISLGALRHYFPTQDDLLVYAMNLVRDRASLRIAAIMEQQLPPREKVLQILLQMIPMNRETTAEMEVWFSFIFYIRHKKEIFDLQHDGLMKGMHMIIGSLEEAKLLLDGLDLDLEAERLYALVDGLAIHAMLEPERINQERIKAVLKRHMDTLCVPEH